MCVTADFDTFTKIINNTQICKTFVVKLMYFFCPVNQSSLKLVSEVLRTFVAGG